MPTLTIGDQKVTVGDEFMKLSPEQKNATVDEIAKFLPAAKKNAGTQQEGPLSWSDVPGQALRNLPSSAGQFVKDFAQPFLHPIETAKNLKNVGQGALEKAGVMSGTDHEQYTDAIIDFFKNRYGGLDKFKATLAKDPVGVAADLATVLSGGEMAAGRLPGALGETARAVGTAGRAIDPLSVVAAPLKVGGKLASDVLGVTTGAGGENIKAAFRAGQKGGPAGQAFRQSLTGAEPVETLVDDARKAVTKLRQERGTIYRQEMQKLGSHYKILDFNKVDQAVQNVAKVKTFKGVPLSTKTDAIRKELTDVVNEWKGFAPAQYHTAEGLDALKQKLGEIRDATQYGTPDRVVADQVYNAVRQTIIDEAPEYARIMKGYEEASTEIKAIERELSVNPKANVDTALRKITSALRDNVNTNFGRRRELVEFLANSGAPHLLEKIAGQSLKSLMPTGLARLAVSGEGAGGLAALLTGNPLLAAKLATVIAAHSPRLAGEAAYGAGRLNTVPARGMSRATYQTGRADDSIDAYLQAQPRPFQ